MEEGNGEDFLTAVVEVVVVLVVLVVRGTLEDLILCLWEEEEEEGLECGLDSFPSGVDRNLVSCFLSLCVSNAVVSFPVLSSSVLASPVLSSLVLSNRVLFWTVVSFLAPACPVLTRA